MPYVYLRQFFALPSRFKFMSGDVTRGDSYAPYASRIMMLQVCNSAHLTRA
jgi:hypothetical protein